jgi:predicted RNA binding protein YcfA (HicA-like mRNA interferase family)
MGSVPILKPAEVCRLLERLGFNAVRQRGSHICYPVVRTAEDRPILFGALGD